MSVEHHAAASRLTASGHEEASTAATDDKPQRTFPHTLTILLIVTLLVWFAAIFIPAGQYQLDEEGRPIAGSYQQIESPLTFRERVTDLLLAPINGLYGVQDSETGQIGPFSSGDLFGAAQVFVFILAIGGFMTVVFSTGALLVQVCATRFGFAGIINRRAVEGLGGIAIDGIVICAIGTLSLGALGANLAPLIILALAAVGWSIFLALVIGRRIFPRHWFEHSIAEFGESQGNVATGFVMLDMVDPARQTDVARAYSYRQLITRPVVGGGFVTALAVPMIDQWGLTAFTLATVALTVALTAWGMRRADRSGVHGVHHEVAR